MLIITGSISTISHHPTLIMEPPSNTNKRRRIVLDKNGIPINKAVGGGLTRSKLRKMNNEDIDEEVSLLS
jgi:hypothetical protein